MSVGGVLGYRLGVGPLHLRPDVAARYNTSARASAVGVGGAVTLGAPIAVGPYAHLGLGLGGSGRSRPVGDAGLLVELGLLEPLLLGVSAGWERTQPPAPDVILTGCSTSSTSTCTWPSYAQNWLVVQATVGISL